MSGDMFYFKKNFISKTERVTTFLIKRELNVRLAKPSIIANNPRKKSKKQKGLTPEMKQLMLYFPNVEKIEVHCSLHIDYLRLLLNAEFKNIKKFSYEPGTPYGYPEYDL
ncbi:hypothetical protein BDF21DRAFT_394080 [Thamnidium elegans]|nr:hypothetical protein BDF21DRAFT_394080 [Thamnidium elegans]